MILYSENGKYISIDSSFFRKEKYFFRGKETGNSVSTFQVFFDSDIQRLCLKTQEGIIIKLFSEAEAKIMTNPDTAGLIKI